MSRKKVVRFFGVFFLFASILAGIHYLIVTIPNYGLTGFAIGDIPSFPPFEPALLLLFLLTSLIVFVYLRRSKRQRGFVRTIPLYNIRGVERVDIDND